MKKNTFFKKKIIDKIFKIIDKNINIIIIIML